MMYLLSFALMSLHMTVAATILSSEGLWFDTSLSPDARARALVNSMTFEEQVELLHGPKYGCQQSNASECAYVGNVPGNSRLGIPSINMNDGPQGFRDNANPGTTTSLPSGMAMAATFFPDMVKYWGTTMGEEFYDKGSNVQLGPGMCVARVPENGRNFEYLSGEDPFLGYKLVQSAIEGIQSNGVIANAKHWVLNNQETNRNTESNQASERTRYELYYPPFVGAIEANVGSFMCSYNKIDQTWSCENPDTLAGDLKTSLNFTGFVMSDWGATHSTSIEAGLDMEMPGADFMNYESLKALGKDGEAAVKDSAYRILKPMFEFGVFDAPDGTWDPANIVKNVTSPEHIQAARTLSAAATVLVKNDNAVLPIDLTLDSDKNDKLTIAMIGKAGGIPHNVISHGGGSGSVIPSYVSTPLDAFKAAAGDRVEFVYDSGEDIQQATTVAETADYVFVFAGTLSSEGSDRVSLSLDDGCDDPLQCKGNNATQTDLIFSIAQAISNNVIVVLSVPGAILMPWSPIVDGILVNFMPGQEVGNALADIVFGDVNPSARLPITMPNVQNETKLSQAQWPGLPKNDPESSQYSEELLIGYRYYDEHDIEFTYGFPFGHGLSYTTFEYDDFKTTEHSVSFTVENTGSVEGTEIPQLYLEFPEHAGEPVKQLKGFDAIVLPVGTRSHVKFELTARDFSIWNETTHAWQQIEGDFKYHVGASSRDIRHKGVLGKDDENNDFDWTIFAWASAFSAAVAMFYFCRIGGRDDDEKESTLDEPFLPKSQSLNNDV